MKIPSLLQSIVKNKIARLRKRGNKLLEELDFVVAEHAERRKETDIIDDFDSVLSAYEHALKSDLYRINARLFMLNQKYGCKCDLFDFELMDYSGLVVRDMDELTENLQNISDQAKAAQQCLYEAAAVIISDYQINAHSYYITERDRKSRLLLLSLRLAQMEEYHNNILKSIKDIAFAEMVRMFNEHTHGALKDQAPQIVAELAEQMKREGRL